MPLIERVLPAEPVPDLAAYIDRYEGGRALEVVTKVPVSALLDELDASGLRGRGGAGFPTGRKWRTILESRSDELAATVVVNGAEGEPGTFKDRAILRANPYHVIEGALMAARVVGADTVIVALKASFTEELGRVRRAVDEVIAAGGCEGIDLKVLEGPGEYLFGEETALLEVIDGRAPLPRIAPPYRRGVDELVEDVGDVDSGSGLAAPIEMASEVQGNPVPPTLVDNVETLANVPMLALKGAEWFREVGTAESPGTIVCTITGRVERPGVGEVALGTTLREAIAAIGGGPLAGHEISAVLPGVSSAFIPPEALDTPLTYETLAAIGSGLGSAGFVVLDDTDDLVAAAAGVSRFLAIESCGQCTACKQDGLVMSELLSQLGRSQADEHDLEALMHRCTTVTDGARCNLAQQQQVVVSGVLRRWGGLVADHVAGTAAPRGPLIVAELLDLDDGDAVIDLRHEDKQPDWTYDERDSGMSPADRLADHRMEAS
jgi:NADH:ubiquinone oxidoreductase subunit F (NADH-binding)